MTIQAQRPRDIFDSQRHVWLFAAVNVLLSIGLTVGHASQSTTFLNWHAFLRFQGEQPFQSRVLPFLIANMVGWVHRLSDQDLIQLFQCLDLAGILVCFAFLWKAGRKLGLQSRGILILFALFWWQMLATFVISPVHNYYYPSDMMSLGFNALAVWMIVSAQALPGLLLLTVLAMLNRETAVVIPFFYLAFHWPASRQVIKHAALLLVACIVVKAAISLSLNVSSDMVSLYHVPGYLRIKYNFSFLTLDPRLLHTLNAFFAFGLVWIGLMLPGRADQRLRRMMLCLVPYLAGMMVVGNLSEIRIFAEFIPLMALLLASKFAGDVTAS